MPPTKFIATVFALAFALLAVSCLHTGRPGTGGGGSARITITEGNAVVKIHAWVSQDLYAKTLRADERLNRPVIQSGTVTRNETRRLSAGEGITFWIVPSEIVTVNVVSVDGNDVRITSLDARGRTGTHTLPGTNAMGLTLAFAGR